jgi:hypothetical protein
VELRLNVAKADGDCDAVGLAVMEAVPVATGDGDKVTEGVELAE